MDLNTNECSFWKLLIIDGKAMPVSDELGRRNGDDDVEYDDDDYDDVDCLLVRSVSFWPFILLKL